MTETLAPVAAVTDPRSLALLKAVGLDKLGPDQRELALNIATRYDLDLLLKHLVMIEGRPYITRDGLLHVAHRSGALDGIETTEPHLLDGFWRATCSVFRKDMSRPFTYAGRYPEQGSNKRFAPEMAVKVAEVMALRRAFDVSAPTAEERWDAGDVPVEAAPRPTLAERAASRAAEVSDDPHPTALEEPTPTPVNEAQAPLMDEPSVMGMTRDEFKKFCSLRFISASAGLKMAKEKIRPDFTWESATDSELFDLSLLLVADAD